DGKRTIGLDGKRAIGLDGAASVAGKSGTAIKPIVHWNLATLESLRSSLVQFSGFFIAMALRLGEKLCRYDSTFARGRVAGALCRARRRWSDRDVLRLVQGFHPRRRRGSHRVPAGVLDRASPPGAALLRLRR